MRAHVRLYVVYVVVHRGIFDHSRNKEWPSNIRGRNWNGYSDYTLWLCEYVGVTIGEQVTITYCRWYRSEWVIRGVSIQTGSPLHIPHRVDPPSATMNTTSAIVNTTGAIVNTTSATMNTTSATMNTTSAIVNTTSAIMNTTSAIMNTPSAIVNTTSAIMNTMTDFNETIGSTLLSPSITSNVPWDFSWQSNNTWDPWFTTWDPWVANRSQHIIAQFEDTSPIPAEEDGSYDWLWYFALAYAAIVVVCVFFGAVYRKRQKNEESPGVDPGVDQQLQLTDSLTPRQRRLRSAQLERRRGLFSCCATQESFEDHGFESEFNSNQNYNHTHIMASMVGAGMKR